MECFVRRHHDCDVVRAAIIHLIHSVLYHTRAVVHRKQRTPGYSTVTELIVSFNALCFHIDATFEWLSIKVTLTRDVINLRIEALDVVEKVDVLSNHDVFPAHVDSGSFSWKR